MSIDYYFFYKNIVRFIVFNKANNIININKFSNIIKLVFFFSLLRIEDCDDVQVYIIYIYLNFFLEDVHI